MDLLNLNDRTLGEWFTTDRENSHPCRFVKVNDTRGKLVYVARPYRMKNLIDREQIKMAAIKKLHGELGKLWKLSQQELVYLINSFEKIHEQLIADELSEHSIHVTLQRVSRTLTGRNFDLETLEFDLEKTPDPAAIKLQKQLAEYRSNPEKDDFSCRSIEELELSVRAYNQLKDHDIQTFGELVHLQEIICKGRKLRGLGRKTQLEILEIIDHITEHSK